MMTVQMSRITEDVFLKWASAADLVVGERIAVAVSGGVDSLALLVLAVPHFAVTALTVDHGLRFESEAEAGFVGNLCKSLGVAHHTLRWTGDKPSADIQNAARRARYDLMERECERLGIGKLLTAHHQDDQAETLLLRLARGSGLLGLSGMAAVRQLASGVSLHRPLLPARREQLEAVVRDRDLTWIEDESNRNTQFDRVKMRSFLKTGIVPGLTVERLAKTTENLRRAQEAVDFYTDKAASQLVEWQAEWVQISPLLMDRNEWPQEIQLRLLSRIIRYVSGDDYGPSMVPLLTFADQMADGKDATLAGVRMVARSDGTLFLCREAGLMGEVKIRPPVKDFLYDEQWHCSVDEPADEERGGWSIGPLGEKGWAEIKGTLPEGHQAYDMPFAVRQGLIALWRKGHVMAVPGLTFGPWASRFEMKNVRRT